MKEYLTLGHMSLLPTPPINPTRLIRVGSKWLNDAKFPLIPGTRCRSFYWEAAVKAAKHRLLRGLQTYSRRTEHTYGRSRGAAQLSSNRVAWQRPQRWRGTNSRAPFDRPDFTLPQEEHRHDIQKGQRRIFVAVANAVCTQVALVHEDNLPPQRWLRGRDVATSLGEEKRVRVAEMKTKASNLQTGVAAN